MFTIHIGLPILYFQRSQVDVLLSLKVVLILADPESFVRGGPNLITFFLVDEGIEDPNITLNGPSSARQRKAI